jgi:hypothetical protein
LFDPHQSNHLLILLERTETEIRFSMANGMFKMNMDINRMGPRLMANNCQHLDLPYFSMPTTFKMQHQSLFHYSQLLFFATNWPQNIKVTE